MNGLCRFPVPKVHEMALAEIVQQLGSQLVAKERGANPTSPTNWTDSNQNSPVTNKNWFFLFFFFSFLKVANSLRQIAWQSLPATFFGVSAIAPLECCCVFFGHLRQVAHPKSLSEACRFPTLSMRAATRLSFGKRLWILMYPHYGWPWDINPHVKNPCNWFCWEFSSKTLGYRSHLWIQIVSTEFPTILVPQSQVANL